MARNAARVAVETEDGVELTYAELDTWSAAVADQLAAAGVGPGDVVALLLGNEPEFLAADVATARLGAAKLPINPLLPATTVAHLLDHSGARVLLVHESLAALAADALTLAQARPSVIATTASGPTDAVLVTAAQAAAAPRAVVRRPPEESETLAALFYTGGTTGLPKGVRHTHASLVAFHQAQLLEAEIRQHDRLLLTTPLAHAAGLFAQSALLRGATVLLRRGFDASTVVRALAAERVTWTFLVPTMLYRVLDVIEAAEADGERVDLSAVDTIVYGAAPISARRLGTALERFGPVFVQLYGQTECPNWGTRLVKSDHDPARPGLLASCGQASIHTDVLVVSEAGEELPVGEIGEICLRSPYLLSAYHRDPDATRAKFLGDFIRTGDVGVLDEAGYLYLKDRRADMIISGGMNVYGKEVEDVLAQHPGVGQVAVIGIPHDDWGEAVHAVVVLAAGTPVDPDELVEWTRGRLAAYARPKSVAVVDALPETAFGKVDKVALRAAHWQGRDRAI